MEYEFVVTAEKLKYRVIDVRKTDENAATSTTGMTMPKIVAREIRVVILKLRERWRIRFLLLIG